ncbi:hypothetical protein V8E55_012201 [Tylopilus felleus]
MVQSHILPTATLAWSFFTLLLFGHNFLLCGPLWDLEPRDQTYPTNPPYHTHSRKIGVTFIRHLRRWPSSEFQLFNEHRELTAEDFRGTGRIKLFAGT